MSLPPSDWPMPSYPYAPSPSINNRTPQAPQINARLSQIGLQILVPNPRSAVNQNNRAMAEEPDRPYRAFNASPPRPQQHSTSNRSMPDATSQGPGQGFDASPPRVQRQPSISNRAMSEGVNQRAGQGFNASSLPSDHRLGSLAGRHPHLS